MRFISLYRTTRGKKKPTAHGYSLHHCNHCHQFPHRARFSHASNTTRSSIFPNYPRPLGSLCTMLLAYNTFVASRKKRKMQKTHFWWKNIFSFRSPQNLIVTRACVYIAHAITHTHRSAVESVRLYVHAHSRVVLYMHAWVHTVTGLCICIHAHTHPRNMLIPGQKNPSGTYIFTAYILTYTWMHAYIQAISTSF
jgi:hypothetical protein